ncbi:MAG: hypothetical protein JW751_00700 [Polyangiaceae bacterium]|nr:hypothetical protein [Polyangiaceae bacterium]
MPLKGASRIPLITWDATKTLPTGKVDLLGGESGLGCRFGPFRFPLELCRRQLIEPGALERAIEAALVE